METLRRLNTAARKRKGERGASLILFTFMTFLVVVPMVGLAIDGAVVFWTKAKLSAAVDAAALAGGRSINVYENQAQNTGLAATAAQQWFSANFPPGWMGVTIVGGQPTITLAKTTLSTQKVSVQATATVPLYFMRIINQNAATVTATAEASRRNVNVILVLDRSGSMGPNGSNACATMQQSAENFVRLFTENFDTLGLVTYSTNANHDPIDYPPSSTFLSGTPSLISVIGQINCTGATNMSMALQMAYRAIKNNGLASGLNVIVLFTDGQPNAMTSDQWPLRAASDDNNIRYDPVYTSYTLSQVQNNPPSTCSSALPTGVLTTLLASGQTPQVQGFTGGLYDPDTAVPLNSSAAALNPPGCYVTNPPNNWINPTTAYARLDIAYVPQNDMYGNATTGYKSTDTFPSGTYAGQIRVDEQINGVIAASTNAADNQAATIRNDPSYSTVIYTIGLGGAPDMPIDATLLERIANDSRSPIYDSTKPTGFFAYASDPSALNAAFQQVASQILRLSH